MQRKELMKKIVCTAFTGLFFMQTVAGAVGITGNNVSAGASLRQKAMQKSTLSQGVLSKAEDSKDNGTFNPEPEDKEQGSSLAVDKLEDVKDSESEDDKTETPKIKNVTMPDWWGKASQLFKRNATARVIDVKTGLMYNIKRMGGTNHADTEPLTAQDTAIMKKIYGGKWSWDRRAIIVEVNGKFYAASQNGMPHGQQTVYDNNYKGQFCIHFKNSKTHGGNKVCPLHQAAVTYAYNAYKGVK